MSITRPARTLIMGILNVTPDSFSDGGRYQSVDAALTRAAELVAAGADILDVGGQSTRPGHTPIAWEEEWARLEPVLAPLAASVSVPISVDTYHPQVAARAVAAGASIINDVSGSLQNGMPALAAALGATLVMTNAAETVGDAIAAAAHYFDAALALADQSGLPRDRIILDVGIGFGKTRADDRRLIEEIGTLVRAYAPLPILVGASRKRVTDPDGLLPPDQRVAATIALHSIAQRGGAKILRVHDVAEAVSAARAIDAIHHQA